MTFLKSKINTAQGSSYSFGISDSGEYSSDPIEVGDGVYVQAFNDTLITKKRANLTLNTNNYLPDGGFMVSVALGYSSFDYDLMYPTFHINVSESDHIYQTNITAEN